MALSLSFVSRISIGLTASIALMEKLGLELPNDKNAQKSKVLTFE
jgi:hypothetical protein